MKLVLMVAGGFLVWLGTYSYMKTKRYVALQPIPNTPHDAFYELFGWLGQFLTLFALVLMGILFEWWFPFVFAVISGFVIAAIVRHAGWLCPALALVGFPVGAVLIAVSFFF